MTNLPDLLIIVVLVLVVIIQALERYFFSEQANKEQSRLIAAILSKNMNEYTQAIKVDKKESPPLPFESDEVDLSSADDSIFDKFLKEQTA